MKKLMAILGVMICHTVPAQNTFHYFNNQYDFDNYETTWSVRIAGDTILTVAFYSGSGVQGINFSFTDSAGGLIADKPIQWPGQYPYPGFSASLTPVESSGYFLTGSTSDSTNNQMFLMVRYNEAGDTLWTRTFDFGFDDIGRNGCQALNGDFLMVGVSDSLDNKGDVLLVCTDSLGDFKWRRFYGAPSPWFEAGGKMDLCPDGGYLISAGKGISGNYTFQSWIIKTDSLGNIEWEKQLGGPYNESNCEARARSEDYIVGYFHTDSASGWLQYGQLRIVCLDSTGNERWNTRCGPKFVQGSVGKLVILEHHGFLVGGTVLDKDLQMRVGFLARFNSLGDSLWYRKYYYHSFGIHYLRDVVSTPEGGFIAAGVCYPPQDRWLLSVDSCGCLFPGCDPNCNLTVGVNEETVVTPEVATLKVFPNPSSGIVYFSTWMPEHEGTLVVYDLTGKVIQSMPVSEGSVQIIFDGSQLKAGIYLAKLFSGDGSVNQTSRFAGFPAHFSFSNAVTGCKIVMG